MALQVISGGHTVERRRTARPVVAPVQTRHARPATAVRPATTIVIPAYNSVDTLPSCLSSVAAQMRPDTQLVLVDDASTDATPEVITRFVAANPHLDISIITQSRNGGAGAARRRGFDAAAGEYLLWLDADDRLAPGALHAISAALRAARRRPSGAREILVFDLTVKRADGTLLPVRGMDAPDVRGEGKAVEALLKGTISAFLWNKAIPRAGLTAEMFSSARRGEDLLTLLAVTEVHNSFRRVPVDIVTYCQSNDSVSQSLDGLDGYLDPEHGLLAEVAALLGRRDLPSRCGQAFRRSLLPRTALNAAVLGARRYQDLHHYQPVARRISAGVPLRHLLGGLSNGDRHAALGLALLRFSPALFHHLANGRRARHWRPTPARPLPLPQVQI